MKIRAVFGLTERGDDLRYPPPLNAVEGRVCPTAARVREVSRGLGDTL